MEDNLNEEEREKLRLENEIRKIKLSLEKGAKFVEDPNMPSLPPEIENEFLNYIEQFDMINADTPQITVYEKCGQPAYKKVEEILEQDIEHELDQLHELLNKHGIDLESMYEVNDREMYRFITEELFNHEMFNLVGLEGMMTQFTYEEFHPNIEEDLKRIANDFYGHYFDKGHAYYKEYTNWKTVNWFEDFREAYAQFKCNHFEITKVTFNEKSAVIDFDISFLAYLDERHTHEFKGLGCMHLTMHEDWVIDQIILPKAA